jgi:hypothetical protein
MHLSSFSFGLIKDRKLCIVMKIVYTVDNRSFHYSTSEWSVDDWTDFLRFCMQYIVPKGQREALDRLEHIHAAKRLALADILDIDEWKKPAARELVAMHSDNFKHGSLEELDAHVLAAIVRGRCSLETHMATIAFRPFPIEHVPNCTSRASCASDWPEAWRASSLWLIYPVASQRKTAEAVYASLRQVVVISMRRECLQATLQALEEKNPFAKGEEIVEKAVTEVIEVINGRDKHGNFEAKIIGCS